MNISQRLRTCAKHTGLDAVIELLNEAADEIDALQARAQVHPTQAEVTDDEQQVIDQIMEQAQVFASAWSLVGGRFDSGDALDDALKAKEELREMVARAILALRPVQVPMTDADTVQVFGVKDGKETLLGTAPMPARMKARELARENFGNFEDGDGSDAELCFGALEQLIDHIERNAHHGITAQAKKEGE